MVHRLMLKPGLRQPAVGLQFVGMDRATFFDVLFDDRLKSFLAHVRNDLRHYVAVTFQHSKHDRLVWSDTPAFAASSASTDIGFISFDIAVQRQLTVHIGHVLTNFVCHAPRRLIGHAQLALQLLRRHAMTRSREQVHRVEPFVERRPRPLHERANGRVQLMFTVLADIGSFARHTVELALDTALRAVQFRTAITLGHDAPQARLIVRVLLLKFVERG